MVVVEAETGEDGGHNLRAATLCRYALVAATEPGCLKPPLERYPLAEPVLVVIPVSGRNPAVAVSLDKRF